MSNIKEGLEIERKFLLKRFPRFYFENAKSYLINQTYIESHPKFGNGRVREQIKFEHVAHFSFFFNNPSFLYEHLAANSSQYDVTHKTPIEPGVDNERIELITKEEYDEVVLGSNSRIISKIRTEVPCSENGGLKWEIDDFQPSYMNLIIAEVELPSKDHPLIIPDYIQKELIMEVTGMSQFTNRALSER